MEHAQQMMPQDAERKRNPLSSDDGESPAAHRQHVEVMFTEFSGLEIGTIFYSCKDNTHRQTHVSPMQQTNEYCKIQQQYIGTSCRSSTNHIILIPTQFLFFQANTHIYVVRGYLDCRPQEKQEKKINQCQYHIYIYVCRAWTRKRASAALSALLPSSLNKTRDLEAFRPQHLLRRTYYPRFASSLVTEYRKKHRKKTP